MMRRAPINDAEMNVRARRLRKSLKKIFREFGLKVTNALRAYFSCDDAVRPSTEVDRRGRKRFIHRHQKISGTKDAAFVADRFRDSFAERDAGVLDGVMLIHVEIAF